MIAAAYVEQIESASTPSDLFGDAEAARSIYRRLARQVHPDTHPDDDRAKGLFERLGEMWAQYNGKTVTPKANAVVYTTKRDDWVLGDLIARGDISNVYHVTHQVDMLGTKVVAPAVLKMPRNPAHNHLVVNEIKALKILKEGTDERYRMFHTETVDSFAHRDPLTGKTRRAIILDALEDFVTLREVADAYPDGVDPKHVAWIARRLLVAMDTAHDAGLVHGAVFPEHVMIHPQDHGVVLLDWSYAQEKGEKLKSAVTRYLKAGWYGGRFDKPLDHRLDVRQAAHTLEMLLGPLGARPFRAFFNGCRVASTPTAGELFIEFDELLERLYGQRKFIPFEMPKGWKRVV